MLTRNKKVTFRMTEKEYESFKRKVQKSCLNQECFIRCALMNQTIHERPAVDWGKAVNHMSMIGNNINQIAHIANISRNVSQESLDAVKDELSALWQYIKPI